MAGEAKRVFVTLYLDADVDPELARQARQRGFDVVSAYEVGNGRLLDPDQLAYAAGQGRAVLTHNARDFAPLFNEWWNAGKSHHGIIVSEQLPIGEMLRRTLKLLNTVTADEMMSNIKNLAEFTEPG
jgi:hypothetical protein